VIELGFAKTFLNFYSPKMYPLARTYLTWKLNFVFCLKVRNDITTSSLETVKGVEINLDLPRKYLILKSNGWRKQFGERKHSAKVFSI
jgi:hypothetical protein